MDLPEFPLDKFKWDPLKRELRTDSEMLFGPDGGVLVDAGFKIVGEKHTVTFQYSPRLSKHGAMAFITTKGTPYSLSDIVVYYRIQRKNDDQNASLPL